MVLGGGKWEEDFYSQLPVVVVAFEVTAFCRYIVQLPRPSFPRGPPRRALVV